jgi:hypothetical protein
MNGRVAGAILCRGNNFEFAFRDGYNDIIGFGNGKEKSVLCTG